MKKQLKIKFVARNQNPPEFINDGSHKITLPKNQSKAFSHKDARAILKLFPGLYKVVKNTRTIYRSAETGKIITKKEALANPTATVKETLKTS